jgi:hypothetical protein
MSRSSLVIILAAGLLLGFGPPLSSAGATWVPQNVFRTQKADIIFDHRADLDELARRLGAVTPDNPHQPELGRLANKIDGMLAEISRILQKWPIRPARLQIRLLRDGMQVKQQQMALALRGPRMHRPAPGNQFLEAYYEPRLRTIFLSLAHAHPGILAHEMTHFILCEAYPVWPSEAFQEELARYIEDRFNRAE